MTKQSHAVASSGYNELPKLQWARCTCGWMTEGEKAHTMQRRLERHIKNATAWEKHHG